MANILTAIEEVIFDSNKSVKEVTGGNNRANNVGDGLESYIKDIFAGTLNTKNKIQKISDTFSYTGAKNHPPDLILKGADAIEVKKIERKVSDLQLNSSHPKSKLTATDARITEACRKCEKWDIKDIIYAVGCVQNKQLKSLWMVYGDCYCADNNTYEKVGDGIKKSIEGLGLEGQETNELGSVSSIDPLNISRLRVRGMWIIKHPSKVFTNLYKTDKNVNFELIVIMQKEKYDSFPEINKKRLTDIDGLSIKKVKIQNPNNPAKLMDAQLLVFKS